MKKLYLSDQSEKDKPWDKHRLETEKVREVYDKTTLLGHAARLDSCSRRLIFAIANPDRKFTLEHGYFCRVRQCPTCQWRRQLMWKRRFYLALSAVEQEFSKHRWILVTFTVRNCHITDLRQTIIHMNQSFQRLTQRKIWPADGFIKSVEVTRNEIDGSAHPHFHVLAMVKPSYFRGQSYIKQDEWKNLWQQCLRVDYLPVVNVKAVKELSHGAKEVLKYALKPSDLIADPEWLQELTIQLHKTRAVSVGGVLSQYMSNEEPSDEELIHGEESMVEISDSDRRFIANWSKPDKRYMGEYRE